MEYECNVEPSKDVEGDSEQSKAPEDDTEKPKDCDKKLLGMEAKQIRKKDRTRVERKPKKPKAVNIENFRSEIANTIVQHLNPYRKPGCKSGHISNTEDFKHLARKVKQEFFFYYIFLLNSFYFIDYTRNYVKRNKAQ